MGRGREFRPTTLDWGVHFFGDLAEIVSATAGPAALKADTISTEMQTNYVRTDAQSARSLRQQRWIRVLPSLIIGLIALVAIGSVVDTSFDRIMGPRLDNYRSQLAKLHHVQMVLSDAQEALLGYAISGRLERLEQFLSDKEVVAGEIGPFFRNSISWSPPARGRMGTRYSPRTILTSCRLTGKNLSVLAAALSQLRPTSLR